MATHFNIIEKTQDETTGENVDLLIWSAVYRSDNCIMSFTDSLMFDIFKNKGKVVMLTKWVSGDEDVTILKRSWVD